MTAPHRRVLLFDSGMGGLTVARAVRAALPEADLFYAADNAAFPYGAWEEAALTQRIGDVMARLLAEVRPDVTVIACNTASTIALAALRLRFPGPFVGTVPAIKPAAAATRSGIIGVLATPGTVKREYTQALIHTYAYHCEVVLHGAPRLAQIAEAKLKGGAVEPSALAAEIAPVFVTHGERRTDVVVLGCTHYPLIVDELSRVAPWPVTFLDPAPAIARRVQSLLDGLPAGEVRGDLPPAGSVFLTAGSGGAAEELAYAGEGFGQPVLVPFPATPVPPLTPGGEAGIGAPSRAGR